MIDSIRIHVIASQLSSIIASSTNITPVVETAHLLYHDSDGLANAQYHDSDELVNATFEEIN